MEGRYAFTSARPERAKALEQWALIGEWRRMKNRWFAGFAAPVVVLIVAGPVLGHHSTAARYDGERSLTITGTLVQFRMISPHSRILVEVQGETGEAVIWDSETSSGPTPGAGCRRTSSPSNWRWSTRSPERPTGRPTIPEPGSCSTPSCRAEPQIPTAHPSARGSDPAA